mmetsp:Transcript_15788/g.20626  ORF Transcript_15788/g.20626 Transcript_15788/m.20626 type:complete len:292 (-) Transcript_15788:212-1087(-)|eukprot:CAMPEP_0116073890 /NCGR_PEP_ID=MMETSP0322-20121206/15562_1 /TAXON_ID=163516 /ORGANISM="Leptocylindrus danicus var. apora, Strain B651" /LENGTH=291 /DNA_ID=CAMNT_0003563351 /DNA_START=103 /DNA_END=978 /DNA_ORIENTATION=-
MVHEVYLPTIQTYNWSGQQQSNRTMTHGTHASNSGPGLFLPSVVGKSPPRAMFPRKLYMLLMNRNCDADVRIAIGWDHHGRSFRVYRKNLFEHVILPRYFHMRKLKSFIRQLSLYGFAKITAGMDKDSYYHPKFLRGEYELCYHIRRARKGECREPRTRTGGFDPKLYLLKPIGLDCVNRVGKELYSSLPLHENGESISKSDSIQSICLNKHNFQSQNYPEKNYGSFPSTITKNEDGYSKNNPVSDPICNTMPMVSEQEDKFEPFPVDIVHDQNNGPSDIDSQYNRAFFER